jgi:isoquinoline 1-oxidoreductase beta subunit
MTTDLSRRALLKATALAGGGLVLHAHLPRALAAPSAPAAPAQLNAWLRISADDVVTIVVSQAEMGQGISTTLPAVLAEELGADWSRVVLAPAPVAPAYRNPRVKWQFTGNSESTSSFFELMRTMGASAREMLVGAAAARWRVAPEACHVELGAIVHAATGRRLRFGDVAAAAAHRAPPAHPALKPRTAWRLLGAALPRVDVPAKVDGSAVFGLDVTMPGLVHAAVKQSPVFGGKVARFDAGSIQHRPGVLGAFAIPDGVAVVAERYWQAQQALAALDVAFADGPNAAVTTETLLQTYRDAMTDDGWVQVHPGRPAGPAAATLDAEYQSQFLAHATMEPMNCTARVDATGCDVWAPTQGPELAQLAIAQVLGLARDQIRIHPTLIGGGFGRRLLADFVVQAVVLAKAVGRPVKVVWSREEDLQHDFYRPAVLHRLRAAFDARGELTELAHRLVSPSILQFVFPPAVTPTMDPSCLEGLYETHYQIPSWKVESKLIKLPVPTSVLRTTGYGPNIFALEGFVDELAHRAGADPYAYRRGLLRDPRALAVLDTAAERAGWRHAAPGRHRGIAFCEAFGTYIAHVVELSVVDRAIRIHRIVVAADPGSVLDPGITRSAIEGGTCWGLSCAMTSEITFAGGRTVQSNWHDYGVVRMPQMPPVEVHLIEGGGKALGGTGEVGPVTLIPALVNAVFAATGQRIRALPLRREGFRWA